MSSQRIKQTFDGELRAVHAGPPLLLSSETPWTGFLLERDLCREGGAQTLAYPHTHLVLPESGAIEVQDRALKREPCFLARRGSVTLWPAGHEARSAAWRPSPAGGGTAQMIRVQLDPWTLQRLTHDDEHLVRGPLQPQPGVEDARLASMIRIMADEIGAGCPAGALFAESLCLALAAYVAQRYGRPVPMRRAPGGLSPRQLNAVRDLVEANLGGDLSLVHLAAVAGLSPHHFATAFRRSVGSTPHQYVLRRRLEEARVLLANNRVPVAEVALTLGFASQSHFAEMFKRFVGMTPKRFQLEH